MIKVNISSSRTNGNHILSKKMQWEHSITSVMFLLCYAKSLQSCPTLCDTIDGSLPGCPVPGILQTRTLEWVAIFFSNAWKWKVKVKSLSRVGLLATPWTPTRLLHPWDFPGKSTGIGCHCLLRMFLLKMQKLTLVMREIPDEPKLREILQNN